MLRAEGLWLEKTAAPPVPLLRGVDLEVPAGRVTVLLGASGAGKTLLARALCGLLPPGVRIQRGRVLFQGREMASQKAWTGIRGREVFYAPQNAAASFNPVLTIGRQIRECSRLGGGELEELLARLQFADPGRVLRSYPFALSGGENQRCLLALALACGAGTLILDEPTSEIDAAAHDEFVHVLLEQQRRRGLSVLLISHHLGFVGRIADRLGILCGGEMVAAGEPLGVLASPVHPYAREIAAYMQAE
ncbi:MAG: ATP-binding cassette domain-containing protein [Acidobacteria bacterium]|nr:ATP-binding cassette domain-containing protein [Acidobacteriota bacterium]